MDQSRTSTLAVADEKDKADVEFKPLEKEEYFIDDEIRIEFFYPDADRVPSYLDVVRIVPLNESATFSFEDKSTSPLVFGFCKWKESAVDVYSVSVKVDVILRQLKTMPHDGIVFVAQYISTALDDKSIAESRPFRVFPVAEETFIELPEVFNDDGLIILGSGSDSEPELMENPDEAGRSTPKSDGDGEEMAIVMSKAELKKIEDENRSTNEKLRSFITQLKADLMELTKCNEMLKQRLYDEQLKVDSLQAKISDMNKSAMRAQNDTTTLKLATKQLETMHAIAIEEEQKKTQQLVEDKDVLTSTVERLRCCVDAHAASKNILLDELTKLKQEKEELTKQLGELQEKLQNSSIDKSLDTSDLGRPTMSDGEITETIRNLIATVKPDVDSFNKLRKDNEELREENKELIRQVATLRKPKQVPPQKSEDAKPAPAVIGLEDKIQDLVRRLRTAKIEYISLYKENKRKEKALEDICNWASLAKNGMSLDAPAPSQIASQSNSFLSQLLSNEKPNFPFPRPQAQQALPLPFTPPVAVKPKELKDSRESFEEDIVELGSENKLSLPPRQKRKIELVRRSSATSTAGASSTAPTRGVQRSMRMTSMRGRPREGFRSLQVKRDLASMQEWTPMTSETQKSSTTTTEPAKTPAATEAAAKPSAPEESADSVPKVVPAASAAIDIPRGSNTYSAAGLISDLETDASNTEEEPNTANPSICPLCVTSIMDYEAHMREAHHKQPCPICGYVFDSNIPLYVMTYHIERHLEDKPDGPSTQ